MNITADLVRQMIAEQFPQWAKLLVTPVAKSGHDNRTFHLGENMSVRLPSGKDYAPQLEKEMHWLPKMQPHITLPISSPIAEGEPTPEYPFGWSINHWIEGDTLTYKSVTDLHQLARDLASFLLELQSIDTANGPLASKHNFYRGGNLSVYHNETQEALEQLALPETEYFAQLWKTGLASSWVKAPVWVHGDIAVGNLLAKEGTLCAVIDFGTMGVGDPACDYVMAWTFFDKESRETFFKALSCDADTQNRAKCWALWKALITYRSDNPKIAKLAKRTLAELSTDEKKRA